MKLVACLLGLFFSVSGFGQHLILTPYSDSRDLARLRTSASVAIHYIGNDFILATTSTEWPVGSIHLKANPWNPDISYFLVWLPEANRQEAVTLLQEHYSVLYSDNTKAIVEIPGTQPIPKPFVHGGIVRISQKSQFIPEIPEDTRYVIDTFPLIYTLMAMVDTGEFMPDIRFLEAYGTRYCESLQALQAQEWIKEQFEQYPGLEVEVQNFPYYGGSSSDNVIATLPGKLHPEEYVAIGAHYDSYSWSGNAPGADDNASGTAAVLELARILSQFEWDRSIIFCTFSAEEVGLVGSEYYASHAQAQGMDILGYFNFDMIGYHYWSDQIHTDMIAPPSALELVNFYKDVAAIYLPDFGVFDAQLTGGDSDHTSFNNNGYMGIFPFEDVPHYSPYIHTPQDLVGPSMNSPEMAATFIQANLASVGSLSVPYDPVGVKDPLQQELTIHLYPNPATEDLTIVARGNELIDITIFSQLGQPVIRRTINGQATIDVSTLSAGAYFVQASSGHQHSYARLMVGPSR